jgi:3-oxoacyl-[acyl-carrier-protein] synthase-3
MCRWTGTATPPPPPSPPAPDHARHGPAAPADDELVLLAGFGGGMTVATTLLRRGD